jgi:hypothetical protein
MYIYDYTQCIVHICVCNFQKHDFVTLSHKLQKLSWISKSTRFYRIILILHKSQFVILCYEVRVIISSELKLFCRVSDFIPRKIILDLAEQQFLIQKMQTAESIENGPYLMKCPRF